jgi:hypothetical protein
VIFGIVVCIPIIGWGSKFVVRLMDRFPIVITVGVALGAARLQRGARARTHPCLRPVRHLAELSLAIAVRYG